MNQFVYEWTLDNIQELCNNPNAEYPFIDSSSFSPPNSTEHKFNLRLYPKGYDLENKDYISLYLHLATAESNDPIEVQFKLSIVDTEGNKFNIKQDKAKLKENNGKGFPGYILRETILNNRLFWNEKLTLLVEGGIITGNYSEIEPDQMTLLVAKEDNPSSRKFQIENKMQQQQTPVQIINSHFENSMVIIQSQSITEDVQIFKRVQKDSNPLKFISNS